MVIKDKYSVKPTESSRNLSRSVHTPSRQKHGFGYGNIGQMLNSGFVSNEVNDPLNKTHTFKIPTSVLYTFSKSVFDFISPGTVSGSSIDCSSYIGKIAQWDLQNGIAQLSRYDVEAKSVTNVHSKIQFETILFDSYLAESHESLIQSPLLRSTTSLKFQHGTLVQKLPRCLEKLYRAEKFFNFQTYTEIRSAAFFQELKFLHDFELAHRNFLFRNDHKKPVKDGLSVYCSDSSSTELAADDISQSSKSYGKRWCNDHSSLNEVSRESANNRNVESVDKLSSIRYHQLMTSLKSKNINVQSCHGMEFDSTIQESMLTLKSNVEQCSEDLGMDDTQTKDNSNSVKTIDSLSMEYTSQISRALSLLPRMNNNGLAGALAGVCVSICLHPIDTVKTVIQSGSTAHKSFLHNFRSIISQQGFVGLYRGIGSKLASSAPVSGIYTFTYETVKAELLPYLAKENHGFAHCIAGGCASTATSFIYTPSECIKQQMQVGCRYSSSWKALKDIMKKGGLSFLYAGWGAVLCRNVPHSVIKFCTYEYLKQLARHSPSTETFSTLQTLVFGGVAASTAALFTTPFDVVKTRLQTQMMGPSKHYKGVFQAFWRVADQEGLGGLYRGLLPRLLIYMSQGALFFASYEFFKQLSIELNRASIPSVETSGHKSSGD